MDLDENDRESLGSVSEEVRVVEPIQVEAATLVALPYDAPSPAAKVYPVPIQ